MTRTDRNLLLMLCVLAAPLLLTACTRHNAAAASTETASAEAPTVRASKMQEVVITASRIDTHDPEEDRRTLPN